jgi:hypothetical protein
MPSYKHTQQSSENKGKPTGQGQDKNAGAKPVSHTTSKAEHDRLKNKYTEGADKPAQTGNVQQNNPNRNTDKTEIDNNKYN